MKEWPKEDIPDEDWLYMWVHRNWIQNGEVQAGFFKSLEMSSEWATYTTPEETRSRGPQGADKYAVIKVNAGEVRKIPGQRIEHTPRPLNRSHADIIGPKTPEVRILLSRIYEWALPLDAQE